MNIKKRMVAVSQACVLGINRSVYRELIKLGWDVSIVVPTEWNYGGKLQGPEPTGAGDPRIIPLTLKGKHFRRFFYPQLTSLLDQQKPDVIFLDADPVSEQSRQIARWGTKNKTLVACLSCENLSFGLRAVFTREGWKGLPGSLAKTWLMKQTVDHISHVFTINNDGTAIFKAMGYRSVSKIPLGFDASFFNVNPDIRLKIRTKLGLDGVVFAYFGRITHEKGVHILLESLTGLKGLEWHLLLDHFNVTGSAYLKAIDQQIEQNGLQERIKFVDPSHKEIAQYMNASDVVVLPSLSNDKWKEQYGRVAPEAMACGCCVVTSDSGALPELVGQAGVIFPEGDVRVLTEKLRQLIVNQELRERHKRLSVERASCLSVRQQAEMLDATFALLRKQG